MAQSKGLDLIEINPNGNPPVAKLMDFGKYQYEASKKLKKAKAGAKPTETKSIQVKIGTGEHDLELKARKASEWLAEGNRLKIDLFLPGRSKYLDLKFLKERFSNPFYLPNLLTYLPLVPFRSARSDFTNSVNAYLTARAE